MDKLSESSWPHEGALKGLLRGMLFGGIAVAAVMVWAVNLGESLDGNNRDGAFAFVLRFILCDAVPLATLLAVFRSVSSRQTIEGLLQSMLSTVLWFFGGFLLERRGNDDSVDRTPAN